MAKMRTGTKIGIALGVAAASGGAAYYLIKNEGGPNKVVTSGPFKFEVGHRYRTILSHPPENTVAADMMVSLTNSAPGPGHTVAVRISPTEVSVETTIQAGDAMTINIPQKDPAFGGMLVSAQEVSLLMSTTGMLSGI